MVSRRRVHRWLPRLAVAAVVSALAGWYGAKWAVWEYHLGAATDHLRKRDFSAALHHLEWCRWARSSDPEGWLLSARTARRAGRYEDAKAWLETASRHGAREREVALERNLIRAQQGQLPDVEGDLREFLANTRSDYPVIAEVLTAEYMRTYRLEEARLLLDRWIELDGADPEPRVRRGWVAEHQLGFDAAVADYRQVLELDPTRDAVRLRIAEICLKLNRPADALPELERVSSARPQDPAVILLLVRCRRELGQLDQAAATLEALSGSVQTPQVVAERAQVAFARGAFAEAETLFRAALREGSPRERAVLYGLQQSLARQGRTAEAEEVERSLKQVDADGRRMNELMTALGRTPGDAGLRFEVATLFLRNGVTDDGVRWLHLTIEADPTHRGAFERLAEYHEKHGPADRAALYRTAARKLAEQGR